MQRKVLPGETGTADNLASRPAEVAPMVSVPRRDLRVLRDLPLSAKRGRPMAQARPNALPVPGDRAVSAFTSPQVLERWGQEAAGVRAVAAGDNVITIFDAIGQDFWTGGGITAKSVTAQLRAIGDRPVEVQINSPGGDMFEGFAIYNVLREHPQDITVKIMGMAASAASIIAMAGNDIQIGAASFVMIHNCEIVVAGNRLDLRETADWMDPFDGAMRDVYAARTSQKPEDCAAWMDAETYMSGSVAIERGFADKLLPADQIKMDAKAQAEDRRVNDLRAMERTLIAAGCSRTDAVARIKKISGMSDSAPEGRVSESAVDPELAGAIAGLIATIRS